MNLTSRTRALFAVLSLLVLGAAIGIALDRTFRTHEGLAVRQLRAVREDPLGQIEKTVDLRPEQRERIAAVLARRQPELDSIWTQTHQRLQATVASVIDEIAAELDPEQAEDFRAAATRMHGPRPELHLPLH